MDKAALIQAILHKMGEERDLLLRAAQTAKEEATSEESRQEGKYDMRGQTAAYMAEGQAKLAAEIERAAVAFSALISKPPSESAAVGSVVTLQLGRGKTVYFLGPAKGGIEVPWQDTEVTVVTPASPIGALLLGKKPGDLVAQPGRPAQKVLSVD